MPMVGNYRPRQPLDEDAQARPYITAVGPLIFGVGQGLIRLDSSSLVNHIGLPDLNAVFLGFDDDPRNLPGLIKA